MMPDDTTVPVLERLEHLLTTTGAHLQSLKRLESDRLRNSRIRDLLEKKAAFENKKSSDRLTSEEETLIAGKSYQYIGEQNRIAQELDRIAEEVRPHLLRKVWPLFPAVEIDYPKTRGFEQEFRALAGELPDDSRETEWLTRFLLRLDTLLRDARDKAYGERASLSTPQLEPPAKEPMDSDLAFVNRPDDESGKNLQLPKRHRGPDYETSRERIDLVKTLVGELTTIFQQRDKKGSVEALRKKYPKFQLWKRLPASEHHDLLGDFKPKVFAENLVLRKYGLTSRETLKADRKKLRKQFQQP